MHIDTLSKSQIIVLLKEVLEPHFKLLAQINDRVGNIEKHLEGENRTTFSIEQVADFFSTSKQTIHNWAKQGLLNKYKVNGRTYFLRADVIELFNNKNN